MAVLRIKVVPGASRNEIAGWLGDRLKIRVQAPPERGKANAAVISLLADVLRVPAIDIRIVTGHGSPGKCVEVDALSDAEARKRLEAAAQ